ncbi:reverse transcriptase [Tanacetum coccineum]
MTLDRWRGYLLDRHFQIKTNYFSLKYFLDQRITTPFQSKWLPKLLGFDYEILYKKGRDNQAADALSRSVHGGELSALVVSTIFSGLIEEVQKTSQLKRKEKLMVGNDDAVRRKLVDHFHSSAEGGHSGPLPILQKVWEDISIYFIDRLPMSGGKFVILVVVDRLSKCMTREKPKEWTQWLPLAEFWYNIKFHSSTKTTPFKIVYGQTRPQYVTYEARECRVEAVDKTLVAREKSIQLLQFYFKRAQNIMKSMADKHRQSVQHKLSAKYNGPFKIIKKVGQVAYKLELPSNAHVHSVFHVSQLKKCKTAEATLGSFPHCRDDGLIAVTYIAMLDRKMVKNKSIVAVQLLIQWANCSSEDAT